MSNERQLPDWLKGLAEFVEDTEAPRLYWLWGGIFTICAALQRKVWIPYGIENIYPNLYLLIVAAPGERKGAPPTKAKEFLLDVEVPVAVDSSSKRALTQELALTVATEKFYYNNRPIPMACTTVISKELSSLLAIDPKGIIELLTDLYDCHDQWKYKTSGKGEDFLYNVCINFFAVTTPTWFATNLPYEAIGGGFTSRTIIVSGGNWYKSVPWPPPLPPAVRKKLINDLLIIRNLVGEFKVDPGAKKLFDSWYKGIPALKSSIHDERIHGFLNRMHIAALKVAMALRISYSNDLTILPDDMGRAIDLVSSVIYTISDALGGHGRSKLGAEVDIIRTQLKTMHSTSFKHLLAMNYRNVTRQQLEEALEIMEGMGEVERVFGTSTRDFKIMWIGKEEEKENPRVS